MWISKEKWKAINKRIDELEGKIPGSPSSESLEFTVYDVEALKASRAQPFYYWHPIPQQKVTVKQAIEKIMAHLGMEFNYIKGKPESVEMRKKPKDA